MVHGENQGKHYQILHALLKHLSDSNIILNLDQCEFSKTTVKVLGNIVSSEGVSPDKIESIFNLPAPKNVSELRSLLGMVNQLRKFTDHLAHKTKPFRDLLSKKNSWSWGYAQDKASKKIKKCWICLLFSPGKQRCLVMHQHICLSWIVLQQQDD